MGSADKGQLITEKNKTDDDDDDDRKSSGLLPSSQLRVAPCCVDPHFGVEDVGWFACVLQWHVCKTALSLVGSAAVRHTDRISCRCSVPCRMYGAQRSVQLSCHVARQRAARIVHVLPWQNRDLRRGLVLAPNVLATKDSRSRGNVSAHQGVCEVERRGCVPRASLEELPRAFARAVCCINTAQVSRNMLDAMSTLSEAQLLAHLQPWFSV